MKKLTLAFAAVAAIALMSLAADPAKAAGFGWYFSSGPSYQTYYNPTPIYYNSGFGQGGFHDDHHADDWHDTSHLHYRPARFLRHGNHFDYVPGRYEIHRTGHWDHVH